MVAEESSGGVGVIVMNERATYDHYTKKPMVVRAMTLDEVKALKYGDHIKVLGNFDVVNVKVNSAVKRWKRDKDRVWFSLKYGLWEVFQVEARHVGDLGCGRCPVVVVDIKERKGER